MIVALLPEAPKVTVEADPPICKVVAFALNKLPVVWLVASVPELAFISPPAVTTPALVTLKFEAEIRLVKLVPEKLIPVPIVPLRVIPLVKVPLVRLI